MYFTSRYLTPMSLDQAAKKAPAILAQHPKSSTSDKYLFVPTYGLLENLQKHNWHIVAAHQMGNKKSSMESKETNKHSVLLIHGNELSKINSFEKGQELPLLKIENSHNGLSSFKICNALFRKVCANGLTMPSTIFAAPTVKHTKNLKNDIIEASYKVLKDYPLISEKINTLKSITLNHEEKLLLAESAKHLVFNPERIKETEQKFKVAGYIEEQMLRPRRYDDKKDDLWTTANIIQESAIRGNVRLVNSSGDLQYTRKVTSIDKDNDINNAIMTLAAKFAELKGQPITV